MNKGNRKMAKTHAINDVRLTTLESILRHEFLQAKIARPDIYIWPESKAGEMASKFTHCIRVNGVRSVSIDGAAFKATLKALTIKPTYTCLAAYVAGENNYQKEAAQ